VRNDGLGNAGIRHSQRELDYREDEGLAAMGQCVALAPQVAFGWLNQGRMQIRHGQHEAALKSLEQTLGLNPRDAPAWRLRADALEALGRLPETLEALNRYAELAPGDIAANNRRLGLVEKVRSLS
jgi:Flp pilus assembly protein TadD